ncbi:hypothetical protein ACVWWN_003462 [Mycobacterium sp. URHB0021]|jgi:hypothetical protein
MLPAFDRWVARGVDWVSQRSVVIACLVHRGQHTLEIRDVFLSQLLEYWTGASSGAAYGIPSLVRRIGSL